MTRLANAPVFKWLLLLLSLIPVGLFAYLGNFSRLMGDDYRGFAKVKELGAWDSMIHWWNTWNGSYSVNGLHGLLEPFGPPIIPQIFPTIIIVLWLIGLSWLNVHVLLSLKVGRNRLPIAIALGTHTCRDYQGAAYMGVHLLVFCERALFFTGRVVLHLFGGHI